MNGLPWAVAAMVVTVVLSLTAAGITTKYMKMQQSCCTQENTCQYSKEQ